MHDYEYLLNDKELTNLLSSINQTDTNAYTACHGSYHAGFVEKRVEKILTDLNYDKRTIEIGKITGLIHDIGCISGKKGHALKSSQMCKKFLCKINVTTLEKKIITQAILDHSNGNNIKSAIGASLLIADKTNLSKKRILNSNDVNNYHKNLLEVDKVDVSIIRKDMIINFVAYDKFSIIKLNELWNKAFIVPVKAAKYLNYTVIFTINDIQINDSLFTCCTLHNEKN